MRLIKIIFFLLAFNAFCDPPFIPNIRVSDDSGATMTINQGESCFTVYKNKIYSICNLAERSVVAMIPFARSFDSGLTWQPNIPWVDQSMGITWHTDPVIYSDRDGGVHIQIQFSIYVIRHYISIDSGETWIDSSNVSDLSSGGSVDKPWGILKNGKIFVAWQEFGGSSPGIRFAKSDDNGANFVCSTIDPGTGGITAIDMDAAGVLYLIYASWGMPYPIYFVKSYDEGNNWTTRRQIGEIYYEEGVGDRAPVPCLAAYGDSILFLVWTDNRYGDWDILGMSSLNGGTTWNGPFRINDSIQGGQCKPWACFDPYGRLHLHYYHTPDWPTTTNSLWSIRYQFSSDSGRSFSPSIRITDTVFLAHYYRDTTFMGEYHMIQADSNYVYSIWTDGRDGNMNLYFSRAYIKPGIEEKNIINRTISIEVPSFIFNDQKMFIKVYTPYFSNINISIYDICGRFIFSMCKENIKGDNYIPINLSQKGVVFIKICIDNLSKIYKSISL